MRAEAETSSSGLARTDRGKYPRKGGIDPCPTQDRPGRVGANPEADRRFSSHRSLGLRCRLASCAPRRHVRHVAADSARSGARGRRRGALCARARARARGREGAGKGRGEAGRCGRARASLSLSFSARSRARAARVWWGAPPRRFRGAVYWPHAHHHFHPPRHRRAAGAGARRARGATRRGGAAGRAAGQRA